MLTSRTFQINIFTYFEQLLSISFHLLRKKNHKHAFDEAFTVTFPLQSLNFPINCCFPTEDDEFVYFTQLHCCHSQPLSTNLSLPLGSLVMARDNLSQKQELKN